MAADINKVVEAITASDLRAQHPDYKWTKRMRDQDDKMWVNAMAKWPGKVPLTPTPEAATAPREIGESDEESPEGKAFKAAAAKGFPASAHVTRPDSWGFWVHPYQKKIIPVDGGPGANHGSLLDQHPAIFGIQHMPAKNHWHHVIQSGWVRVTSHSGSYWEGKSLAHIGAALHTMHSAGYKQHFAEKDKEVLSARHDDYASGALDKDNEQDEPRGSSVVAEVHGDGSPEQRHTLHFHDHAHLEHTITHGMPPPRDLGPRASLPAGKHPAPFNAYDSAPRSIEPVLQEADLMQTGYRYKAWVHIPTGRVEVLDDEGGQHHADVSPRLAREGGVKMKGDIFQGLRHNGWARVQVGHATHIDTVGGPDEVGKVIDHLESKGHRVAWPVAHADPSRNKYYGSFDDRDDLHSPGSALRGVFESFEPSKDVKHVGYEHTKAGTDAVTGYVQTHDATTHMYEFSHRGHDFQVHVTNKGARDARSDSLSSGVTKHFEVGFGARKSGTDHPYDDQTLLNATDPTAVVASVHKALTHHLHIVGAQHPSTTQVAYNWSPTKAPTDDRHTAPEDTRRGHFYQKAVGRLMKLHGTAAGYHMGSDDREQSVHLHFPNGLINHLPAVPKTEARTKVVEPVDHRSWVHADTGEVVPVGDHTFHEDVAQTISKRTKGGGGSVYSGIREKGWVRVQQTSGFMTLDMDKGAANAKTASKVVHHLTAHGVEVGAVGFYTGGSDRRQVFSSPADLHAAAAGGSGAGVRGKIEAPDTEPVFSVYEGVVPGSPAGRGVNPTVTPTMIRDMMRKIKFMQVRPTADQSSELVAGGPPASQLGGGTMGTAGKMESKVTHPDTGATAIHDPIRFVQEDGDKCGPLCPKCGVAHAAECAVQEAGIPADISCPGCGGTAWRKTGYHVCDRCDAFRLEKTGEWKLPPKEPKPPEQPVQSEAVEPEPWKGHDAAVTISKNRAIAAVAALQKSPVDQADILRAKSLRHLGILAKAGHAKAKEILARDSETRARHARAADHAAAALAGMRVKEDVTQSTGNEQGPGDPTLRTTGAAAAPTAPDDGTDAGGDLVARIRYRMGRLRGDTNMGTKFSGANTAKDNLPPDTRRDDPSPAAQIPHDLK